MCKYHPKEEDFKLCTVCGCGLCENCGKKDSIDEDYCNECFTEENGVCSKCGTALKAIWENNGFTEPYGPSHYEITGYEPCTECGY